MDLVVQLLAPPKIMEVLAFFLEGVFGGRGIAIFEPLVFGIQPCLEFLLEIGV